MTDPQPTLFDLPAPSLGQLSDEVNILHDAVNNLRRGLFRRLGEVQEEVKDLRKRLARYENIDRDVFVELANGD